MSGLISDIMSSPVLTIDEQTTLSSLIATVMKKAPPPLCGHRGWDRRARRWLGSSRSTTSLKTQGSHPTVILTEIGRAKTKQRLRGASRPGRGTAAPVPRRRGRDGFPIEHDLGDQRHAHPACNSTCHSRSSPNAAWSRPCRFAGWRSVARAARSSFCAPIRTTPSSTPTRAKTMGRRKRFFLELGTLVVDIPGGSGVRALPRRRHGEQPEVEPAAHRVEALLLGVDPRAGEHRGDAHQHLFRLPPRVRGSVARRGAQGPHLRADQERPLRFSRFSHRTPPRTRRPSASSET